MDRRSFVKNAAMGSAALYLNGIAMAGQSDPANPKVPRIAVKGIPQDRSPLGMPRLFPGRVVELENRNAISRNRVSQPVIKEML